MWEKPRSGWVGHQRSRPARSLASEDTSHKLCGKWLQLNLKLDLTVASRLGEVVGLRAPTVR